MKRKGRIPTSGCGPFLLALLLCGCNEGSRPTTAEDDQLNNAAEMLDSAPETLSNIDGNADQPAASNASL